MAYLGNKTQAAREAKLLRHNAVTSLESAKAMQESGNTAAAKALRKHAAALEVEAATFD